MTIVSYNDIILIFHSDRNDPPNHTAGKKLAPRSRKGMSLHQDLVYTVPSCLPSTSKAATSDKADLLMGAILRSHKTDDASSSLLAKCDQRTKPCDKCELIDERTIPSSLIRTARTESSKHTTVKTHNPQCLSYATNGKCSDYVPLKLTSVGDRTKGGASDSDDKIQPEVDDRKDTDVPFLNRSLGRIKEFFKGEVKPAQENVEVSRSECSVVACSLNIFVSKGIFCNWAVLPKEHTYVHKKVFTCFSVSLNYNCGLCSAVVLYGSYIWWRNS
jgi:hypothetical protein